MGSIYLVLGSLQGPTVFFLSRAEANSRKTSGLQRGTITPKGAVDLGPHLVLKGPMAFKGTPIGS